ncbi:MAG: hypothetical protein JNK37_05260 [Verrucomicrobiales bacterium]|nr:hypothetical protein [Verrucomicrobiales bacterium]
MEHSFLPLCIAVTGHREIHPDEVQRIGDQMRHFFKGLCDKYPHTPLMLLSALGPGADRLAARIAAEVEGIDLVAVLPWSEGICDDYWHRGGDREEFDSLLAQARHRVCLPPPAGIVSADLHGDAVLRETCYETVGRYLTRHCQALIAIWDGVERADSQTWQVIRWHREGIGAPFAAGADYLDEPETGPVWRFPARRGAREPALATAEVVEEPVESLLERFNGIATDFDRFNRDVGEIGTRVADGRERSKGYLFPPAEQAALPPQVAFLLERFAMADQLAQWWQGISQRVLLVILGLIFLTVTLFECYAHVAPGRVSLLLGYPLLFGFGVAVVWLVRRWRVYNRYLDYRALAEAMRVHLFWKLARLPESAADYYLRSCRGQLDWIRAALRAWSVQSGEHDCQISCPWDQLPDADLLRQVRERWMEDQRKFFAKNHHRDRHRAHVCHEAARWFLGISLVATLVQSARLLWAYGHHDHHIGHDGRTHAFIMLIAMGGVLAGLCHEYLEKRLFEKQARSYGWMASLYETALRRFDPLVEKGEYAQAQSLIRELGREALAENADWVIYHREREPEMKGH